MEYQHTQRKSILGLAAFVVAMAAVRYTFNRLTVSVGQYRVDLAFGWGLPRRTIPLDDITAVHQVRTPRWSGYGIRRIPKGWLYNVAGRDAVEVTLTSGKIVRIGTDDPEGLLGALSDNLAGRTT